MTRIPNASARLATSAPIRPDPTRPRVFPNSSRPSSFFFSHLPSLTDRSASVRCRRREIMWPSASSATLIVLAVFAVATNILQGGGSALVPLYAPAPPLPTPHSLITRLAGRLGGLALAF